jgi:predicted hotdog family 3-hydroxylacyl-ACP dehydratase
MSGLPLHRSDFEHLIPHAGAMCLLSRVVACDAESIRCEADNHADIANPLRNAHGLPVTAGIEYAAQGMALHAALQRDGGGAIQGGAIAVLSDVAWTIERLDAITGPLSVEATLLAGTAGGRQYRFAVGPGSGDPVLSGVMIVAFS